MSAIPTNTKLSEDEIKYLENYLISFCNFDSRLLKKIITHSPQFGSKIFLDKFEFKTKDKLRKLKPLTAFFELLYPNLLNCHDVKWGENDNSHYLTIDNAKLFEQVIIPFEDTILVNDTLDLTICSTPYYSDYSKKEFSKIGELLHTLKIDKKQEIIPDLMSEIKTIINKFDFSIYGKNIVVMPMRSSTPIVSGTAQMIADKMKWEIQPNTIGIIDESHPVKIKKLKSRSSRLHELNENVSLWSEGIPKGKDVLLIDDNYQSGATINFISMLLKKYYNVKKVYCFCLTKTTSNFNPKEGGHYE